MDETERFGNGVSQSLPFFYIATLYGDETPLQVYIEPYTGTMITYDGINITEVRKGELKNYLFDELWETLIIYAWIYVFRSVWREPGRDMTFDRINSLKNNPFVWSEYYPIDTETPIIEEPPTYEDPRHLYLIVKEHA